MIWPIVFLIVCLFLVLLPTYTKPVETGIAALITLMGVPVYMVTIYWQNKPRIYKSFIGKKSLLLKQSILIVF